jgi:CO dehydrogenase/acetyl-CoA synthase beta subunit
LVDATTVVLISNTVIMAITAIATIFRIKIEKFQVKVMAENAEYRRRIEAFKEILQKEKSEFLDMKPEEVYEMLMKVLCDANNS